MVCLRVARRLETGLPMGRVSVAWTVGALVGAGALWLAARRLSVTTRVKIALAATSVLCGLLLIDFTVGALPHGPDARAYLRARHLAGSLVYPACGHGCVPGAPFLSGLGEVPTLTNFPEAFPADRHGFENPPGLYDAHERLDVFVLGDSFVHGKRVVPVMRALLGTSVYNAGYTGDGPLAELATLVEYGAPKRPRVVVWFFYEGNDLSDILEEKRHPDLARYWTSAFPIGLVSRVEERDARVRRYLGEQLAPVYDDSSAFSGKRVRFLVRRFTTWLYGLPESSGLFALYQRFFRARFQAAAFDDLTAVADVCRTLATAKTVTEGWGGELAVVYLPEYRRFAYAGYGDRHRQRVMACIASLRLRYVDLTSRIAAVPDAARVLFNGDDLEPWVWKHPNRAGGELIGRVVADFLREQNLTGWPGRAS
jgi:hypothetical protein